MLFLSATDEDIGLHRLSELVREYVDSADVGKRGSCHLFRHSMATLMLEGGADIRFIQQMLGHARIASTELYTKVIRQLQRVSTATHPAALAEHHRLAPDDYGEDAAAGAAELMATLATEAAEEDSSPAS